MKYMIILLILIPLSFSVLSPWLVKYIRTNWLGWLLSTGPLLLFLIILTHSQEISTGRILTANYSWFPSMNINFMFRFDGLSQLFALLVTGVGTLIVIYSKAYFKGDYPHLGYYYSVLFFFMAAMLGTLIADNLIMMFVFWELTSVCSFLLIGLNYIRKEARVAALQALFVTAGGGLCLLAAFILLADIAGTQQISLLVSQKDKIFSSPRFNWILALFFMGVFTKSAQFPFSFWLPGAMQAPTPISAYLHSATLVQLGIYLLARFHGLFSGSALWFIILTTIGGITMLTSIIKALTVGDLKLILAYTTVTALGSLVFSLAGTELIVIKAAVAFVIVHGLYKATLFMAVGDIQHQTQKRDINKLSGLFRAMPITFLAICVAGASMAGIPPLLGFYVKELVYEASLAEPVAAYILTFIVVFANMMMAAIAFVLIIKPFWGKEPLSKVREANVNMSVNALLLATITLLLSIFPEKLNQLILSPAAGVIIGHEEQTQLAHVPTQLTPSLLLSMGTILGAVIVYLMYETVSTLIKRLYHFTKINPKFLFYQTWKLVLKTALFITQNLQTGKLSQYLFVIFTFLAMLLVPLTPWSQINHLSIHPEPILLFALSWLLIAAISILLVTNYLTGLIWLGVFGLGLTFFFISNQAPDVAMTQMLIESLVVILVVFNLYRQKAWPPILKENNWHRVSRGGVALLIGLSFSVILFIILNLPFDNSLNNYFLKNSLPVGKGKNVVNVILVDFRSLDTLGEAVVLLLAGLGVYALLHNRREKVR